MAIGPLRRLPNAFTRRSLPRRWIDIAGSPLRAPAYLRSTRACAARRAKRRRRRSTELVFSNSEFDRCIRTLRGRRPRETRQENVPNILLVPGLMNAASVVRFRVVRGSQLQAAAKVSSLVLRSAARTWLAKVDLRRSIPAVIPQNRQYLGRHTRPN